MRPDGVAFAASEPLDLEATGTEVEATLPLSGQQVVLVRSPKGTGAYLLSLQLLEEGGTGAAELGHAQSRVHLVSREEGARAVWRRSSTPSAAPSPPRR